MIERAIAYLEQATADLKAFLAEQDVVTPQAPALLAEVPQAIDEPDRDELPYKCPACGRTYAEQVECAEQHPPEQTLPTADVLEGAPPSSETPAAAAPEEPPATGPAPPAPVAAAGAPEPSPAETTADPPTPPPAAGSGGGGGEPGWPK